MTPSARSLLADGSWQRRFGASLPYLVTAGLLLAAIVINAVLQPTFFTAYSLTSNFATFVPLVFVAVAQAIVIIGGGLDLSIGAIVALSSVTALTVMKGDDALIPLGVLVAVLTGALCGLFNGLLVSAVRLQPLIATFATTSIFAGLTLLVLPSPGGAVPGTMTAGYRMAIALVPVPVLGVLGAVLLWFLLTRTRLVRHIYAVGGDADAAYASLVPASRARAASYVIAGTFAGLAALAVLANTGSGDPFVGQSMALDSIAAVVLGGVALSGGRGSAYGAIAGALILSLTSNILFYLGVPTTYRALASGIIIILALALSVTTSRRQA